MGKWGGSWKDYRPGCERSRKIYPSDGLKAHFGNRACYFSPYAEEFFKDSLKESCSTGQEALSHLRETFAYAPVKLFLLDEWDANLDQKTWKMNGSFSGGEGKKLLYCRGAPPVKEDILLAR